MNDILSTPASEPTPVAPAAPKKPRKAEHDWIDAKGDVTENLEEATGIKYRDINVAEGDPSGVFTYQIPGAEAGKVQTMFAVWGARTKATNSALAATEKRKRDNTFDSTTIEHIAKLFGEIADGQWGAPSDATPKGPKYDLDTLADVIMWALIQQGATPDLTKIRAKCGDSPAYVRGAMLMPEVANEYNRIKGVAPKGISSLLV